MTRPEALLSGLRGRNATLAMHVLGQLDVIQHEKVLGHGALFFADPPPA